MEIDLFTWGAQIVNFLILVALLRHFLYGRIVSAIDARQEKIASRWEDAEREKEQAAERAREYESKQEELETQREKILSEARTDAESRRDELTRQARAEVDELRSQWQKALEQEKRSFVEDLRQAAATEIGNALRHVLRDLADAELQSHAVRRFVERLADSQEQAERVKDLVAADTALTVKTSFELTEPQQKEIRHTIENAVEKSVDLQFATSAELLCGIELRGDGRKIAWSVQDYLGDLDKNIDERLQQRRWNKPKEKESHRRDESGQREKEAKGQQQHGE